MTKSYVLPNRITRLKRQNRMLPTEATFNRVWEQMELLKSKSSIKMFLKKSISNNYKNLDIDLIKNGRNKFNISKGMPERFINVDEVDEAANKVSISIGQAHEYFKAANKASPMTKPLILYYGMVSFAKALISSTYCIHDKNRGHGLFVFDNDEFKVTIGNKNHNMGEYQSFRDCYMGDTSLYTRKNPLKFNLKDLLAVIPGIRMEWMLAYQKEFDERYYDIHQMPPKHHKYFKIKSYIPLKVVLKTSNDDFNVIYDLGDAGEIHKPKYVINLGIHGYDFG
ncbi:MAG: YaaC family protein [Methanobacterium sp.]